MTFNLSRKAMTPAEFKERWESDGGGITYWDMVACAKDWRISRTPESTNCEIIRYKVLAHAECSDADEYLPNPVK